MNNKLYIFFDNKDHRTSYFKPPPVKIMKEFEWNILDYNDVILSNYNLFINYLNLNNIKVIMCFYYNLIKNFDEYLIANNISILIYSNDLHYKPGCQEKHIVERNHIHSLENIYICANYYYCYQNFYKINPKRIIKYPAFVDDDFFVKFNSNPINKILLCGSKTKEYPARKKLNTIAGYNNNIDVLKNGIYLGYEYVKYLNTYLCCFTCCANRNLPYIIGKFFEIPSSGSLLLAYDEFVKDELVNLGFIDGVNYISCSLTNMDEKIAYITDPNNLEKINEIRKNGYEFVWKDHKQTDRLKYINDFVNEKLL